ncbi:MAG: hypothetical protein WA421_09035 [Nitrososphaeraceae archaeon]
MFQNKKYNQEKHATEITLLSSNENVMVTGGSRVVTGGSRVVTGGSRVVTGGSSSFIILFYCIFITYI